MQRNSTRNSDYARKIGSVGFIHSNKIFIRVAHRRYVKHMGLVRWRFRAIDLFK